MTLTQMVSNVAFFTETDSAGDPKTLANCTNVACKNGVLGDGVVSRSEFSAAMRRNPNPVPMVPRLDGTITAIDATPRKFGASAGAMCGWPSRDRHIRHV